MKRLIFTLLAFTAFVTICVIVNEKQFGCSTQQIYTPKVSHSQADQATEKPKTIKEFVSLIRSTPVLQSRKSTDEIILQRELEGFFMDIPEVVWCKFVGNIVYVGFRTYPHDGEAILKGAALHGNNAINFGCHVWAVHADQKNNPPHYGTFSGKWYDNVTARYGRFE